MITAGVHLYGSQRGYRTIAHSADVTATEDAGLAGIGFGQANAPSMLASLNAAPTALGRRLPSGRFAITRALPGAPDDAGRPTIVLCSLVFSADDYVAVVRHHLPKLVGERSLWDAERFATGDRVTLRLPAGAQRRATEADLRVADAWLQAMGRSDTLAVLPDGSEGDLLALPQVLSADDALRCRWGVRLLGVDAGAEVATLVQGAATGRRRTLPCGIAGPYRSQWLAFLATRGEWTTPLVLHRGRTEVEEGSTTAPATSSQPTRRRRGPSPLALAALVGGGCAVAAIAIIVPLSLGGGERRTAIIPDPPHVAPPTSAPGNPAPRADVEAMAPSPPPPPPEPAAQPETKPPPASEGRVRRFGDGASPRGAPQPPDEPEAPPSDPPTRPGADHAAPPAEGAPPTRAAPPAKSVPPATPVPGPPVSMDQRMTALIEMLAQAPPDRRFDEFNALDRSQVTLLFARVAADLSECAGWRPIELSPMARERLASIRRTAQDRAALAASGAAWFASIVERPGSRADVAPDLAELWRSSAAQSGRSWDSPQRAEEIRAMLQMLRDVGAKLLAAGADIDRMRTIRDIDIAPYPLEPIDESARRTLRTIAPEVDKRLDRWSKRVERHAKEAGVSAPRSSPPPEP